MGQLCGVGSLFFHFYVGSTDQTQIDPDKLKYSINVKVWRDRKTKNKTTFGEVYEDCLVVTRDMLKEGTGKEG